MEFDYNMSQSIFNMNIGLIYIYQHIELRIQGNLMVTYQEIQNIFSSAITFKFNTVFQISRATTTLSFYQDCISNLSRAPFITASIHHSYKGVRWCRLPLSIFWPFNSSSLWHIIGKQTNWSKKRKRRKTTPTRPKQFRARFYPVSISPTYKICPSDWVSIGP